ncbi:MAG: RNA polymerase factor sigma-54 [Mangrovicoccus sp.]
MALKTRLQNRQTQVFRLGQVVSLLKLSAVELEEYLSVAMQENPMLIRKPRPATSLSTTDIVEMTAVAAERGLYDHAFQMLAGLISQGGMMERVITALIAELDPSGWLGRDPAAIARDLGVSEELLETALRVVQKRSEPPGLFARDLEECLRLQLIDLGKLDPATDQVLAHLSLLASGGITALKTATDLGEDELRAAIAQIRQLNPKPGAAFAPADPSLTRAPDVRIAQSRAGWEIEFLSDTNDIDIAALPRGPKTSDTSEAIAQARALKRALEVRQSALRQVVGAVVKRQGAFFQMGAEALEPMSMSDIAEETAFSLSTVSRVLNGLLIEGPAGIIPARRLFARTASGQTSHCKPKVQARIRAVLSKEDPKKPISDRQLTAILQGEGIAVSRRVVSNYRQEIGFEAAGRRKALG